MGRCLRSLFSQINAPEFEIIVVDDASDDATALILEAFSTEITVLRNNPHLGLPASLNLGIKASCGD